MLGDFKDSVYNLCGILKLAASVHPWLECVSSEPAGGGLGSTYYYSSLLNARVTSEY